MQRHALRAEGTLAQEADTGERGVERLVHCLHTWKMTMEDKKAKDR